MAEAVEQAEDGLQLDEQRLVNALEANIVEADTIQGSEISEQRQRNHIHYAMDRLGNEKKGRSQHISADVHDSVESQKALYLESLASNGRSALRFLPESDQDTTAHLATEYVNIQMFHKNKGYRFLRDSLHDAMVAKRCVAKVEWVPDSEITVEEFKGFKNQIPALLQRPDILGLEEYDEDTIETEQGDIVPIAVGKVRREKDTSRAHVCPIQPERYFRDPNVAYIDDAAFAGYQADLSRFQLIDMGFDPDEVMNLDLDYRFRQNEEDAARKAHDATWSRARRHKREPEQEIVTVYWHWAYLDLGGFGGGEEDGIANTKLYKFVWSQGELLTLPETGAKFEEEQDGFPFVEWVQYKISHSEHGLCEADVVGPIQWSKSNILNLSIDNVAMNNTSRWKAKHGFIKNPRELLDNNIGGIMWMKELDALEPLPTAPLSPNTMAVYQQLNEDKEQRTGQSSLSKGMNTDAIRYQNADDMIERLTNASNRRVMRGVRDFAEEYLTQIGLKIYNLGRKYDTQEHTVELKGEWVTISMADMPERSNCEVKTALTPDETMKHSQFLLMMYQLQAVDPELQPLFGMEQRHAMIDDVYDMMGMGDTTSYLLQPDDDRVKEAAAQEQSQQQQMMQMQQQMLGIQMQMTQKEDQRKDLLMELKVMAQRLDEAEFKLKSTDTAADNLRKDDELDHTKWKDSQEIEIERTQKRPAAI